MDINLQQIDGKRVQSRMQEQLLGRGRGWQTYHVFMLVRYMLQPNELLNLAPKNTVDIAEIKIWVYRIDQASIRSDQEHSRRDRHIGGIREAEQP